LSLGRKRADDPPAKIAQAIALGPGVVESFPAAVPLRYRESPILELPEMVVDAMTPRSLTVRGPEPVTAFIAYPMGILLVKSALALSYALTGSPEESYAMRSPTDTVVDTEG